MEGVEFEEPHAGRHTGADAARSCKAGEIFGGQVRAALAQKRNGSLESVTAECLKSGSWPLDNMITRLLWISDFAGGRCRAMMWVRRAIRRLALVLGFL